jgi:serine phosphatase RsbU (regulator of sigma subunit)
MQPSTPHSASSSAPHQKPHQKPNQKPNQKPSKAFQWLMEYSFGDYQAFAGLPLRSRLRGALGLALMNMSVMFALHLALHSSTADVQRIVFAYGVYSIAILAGAAIAVFPQFQSARNYKVFFGVMMLVGGGFGAYSSASLSTSAHAARQDFLHFPDVTTLVLFLAVTLSVTAGLRLYSSIMRAMVAERARMGNEFSAAQALQQRLVPVLDRSEAAYAAYGSTQPSSEVGGDYFDVVRLSDHSVAVAIGDVSGHGMAAGLLMAVLRSAFRTELKHMPLHTQTAPSASASEPDAQSLQALQALQTMMRSLNETICDNAERGMFVSFQCLVLDFAAQRCFLANAGHLPVLHTSRGAVSELHVAGMALGLVRQTRTGVVSASFQAGDVFTLLTDGIVEAANSAGGEYGLANVKHAVATNANSSRLERLHGVMLSHVRAFTGTQDFADDVTVLNLRVL